MASKKEILKACPLSIDQIFSVYEAYNTHLHKDQPHLIHTTLKYRSAETGKLVFVLVHALIDEGDIEIFESTPVEAALRVFPDHFGKNEGKQLEKYLKRVRGWMEESDVDGECFKPFLEWLKFTNPEHPYVIARATEEYEEYWDSPG